MFYNIDCIEGARKHLADNSVDLIITDPPYGIEGHSMHKLYNREETQVLDGYVDVAAKDYPEFSKAWIKEAARVLRPGGSLYIISGYTRLVDILNALRETKLQEVNHIIWKYNFGVYTKNKYISSHCHILYYRKKGGTRTFNSFARFGDSEKNEDEGSLNYLDREDVWTINREYKHGQTRNKNELPDELLIKMIQYSSNPGDLVCDFFLGSFSTARVAIGLNRKACGFEINTRAYKHHLAEIEMIKPGSLDPTQRKPAPNRRKNQGKRLLPKEKMLIEKRWQELSAQGESLKSASLILTEEFGRGYWSIRRILRLGLRGR